ncbi:MAG: hypothetical protein M1830_009719 [Pleopsidium flavum]|nr:MAG: hypothetical protein M1830_009719 [Pleopsidium flavum]
MQAAVGTKSVYTVLGSKMAEAKRKKEEKERERRESVVDDWEEEVRKEEEAERVASGGEEVIMGSTGDGEKDVHEEASPHNPMDGEEATLEEAAAIESQVDAAVNQNTESKTSSAVTADKPSSLSEDSSPHNFVQGKQAMLEHDAAIDPRSATVSQQTYSIASPTVTTNEAACLL